MRRPFLHIVIAAGCAAVLAGACGSDESSGTTPEPGTTGGVPVTTAASGTTTEPGAPTTTSATTEPATTAPATTAVPTTEPAASAAPTTAAATTVPTATVEVLIYGIRDEHLVALGRQVAAATPAAAMDALVGGLTPDEVSAGLTTMIPADTVVHDVVVDGDGDEVTVDLSAVFDTGGGSLAITARVAQTVFTLTQFPGIDTVRFAIDGTVVTSLTGEGVMVDGTGRLDWESLIPLILVEQPVPGATVDQPIHVRGMSNTFEAGINYQVLASDRTVLVEGYFMATSGTGTWGTFDADLDPLPPGTTGEVIVRLFEYSAKDGEPVNITETPVTLT